MTRYFGRSILFGALILGSPSLSSLAQAQTVEVPPVPTNIQVDAGYSPYLKGLAIGTQNFICVAPKKEKEMAWKFTGPQATLFLTLDGEPWQQVTTHFLSANPGESGSLRPTWQHSVDTSAVWGRVKASSSDPDYVASGAIPWLLLEVAGAQLGPMGGNVLTEARFIHRVNTTGGLMPSEGCSELVDIGTIKLVPYTAEYFFYRADQ